MDFWKQFYKEDEGFRSLCWILALGGAVMAGILIAGMLAG